MPRLFLRDLVHASLCKISEEGAAYLDKVLTKPSNEKCVSMGEAKLLYRGSLHGFYFKDFHKYCDNKGPTVTLMQIEDGDCIGGYTEENWSTNNKYVEDKRARLFNLSKQSYFPS